MEDKSLSRSHRWAELLDHLVIYCLLASDWHQASRPLLLIRTRIGCQELEKACDPFNVMHQPGLIPIINALQLGLLTVQNDRDTGKNLACERSVKSREGRRGGGVLLCG